MENKTLNFELVSPEEKLVSGPVKMAVIPGEEGVMGVGAGHTSLVSSLNPGLIELHPVEGTDTQKIFIAGGFADISDKGCSVLAEEAIPFKDLDQQEIEQKISNLNEDLGLAVEDIDKTRIQRQIVMEQAKLRAVQSA